MAFPPPFLDEIRARAPLAEVVGRRVKLTRRGREHSGLCPFHKEKTPSFTVSEDKGFFHCFGCGAHGDVIGFAMQSDGLSFPEAVTRLAGECGLTMPERTPEAAERAERQAGLYEVVEAATQWFETQLAGAVGAAARDYLRARGLDDETIGHFRLGFAPDRSDGLKLYLKGVGVDPAMAQAAGLLGVPDDDRPPYDFFRGRVMFPITDGRGRPIAFGGRTLGAARAKYINSPETDLFHKGRALYNLAGARRAAREFDALIVAEGYMDVIALHRAGLTHAVAPLGTALSEDQLGLMWRLAAEPVLCLDGDEAGRRAAIRAAERALPLLRPGRSLRFAFLPPGADPDSVIAEGGRAALAPTLDAARPLVDVLWELEVARNPADTPERRAGLRKSLDERVAQIADKDVRAAYFDEFRNRFEIAFPRAETNRKPRPAGAARRYRRNVSLRDKALGSGVEGEGGRREQVLVATVVNHPDLLAAVEEDFARVEIATPELDRLRQAVLEIYHRQPQIDRAGMCGRLTETGHGETIGRLLAPKSWRQGRLLEPFARPDADLTEAEKGWRHILRRHDETVHRTGADGA